jgi:hypothetical protein
MICMNRPSSLSPKKRPSHRSSSSRLHGVCEYGACFPPEQAVIWNTSTPGRSSIIVIVKSISGLRYGRLLCCRRMCSSLEFYSIAANAPSPHLARLQPVRLITELTTDTLGPKRRLAHRYPGNEPIDPSAREPNRDRFRPLRYCLRINGDSLSPWEPAVPTPLASSSC